MAHDLDTACELFEIAALGMLATAFKRSGQTPSAKYWSVLRGEQELTMRHIGEIAAVTDTSFHSLLTYWEDEPAESRQKGGAV